MSEINDLVEEIKHSFHQLEAKIDNYDEEIDRLESRIAELESENDDLQSEIYMLENKEDEEPEPELLFGFPVYKFPSLD